jgi:hypothetical protein
MNSYTDTTLRGIMWVDEAARCLLNYRDPGVKIMPRERVGLAAYYQRGYSPSDAADAYQASST